MVFGVPWWLFVPIFIVCWVGGPAMLAWAVAPYLAGDRSWDSLGGGRCDCPRCELERTR